MPFVFYDTETTGTSTALVVPRGVVYELKGANASEASSGNRR